MCLFTAHLSSPKPSEDSLLPQPPSGWLQVLARFLECMNQKELETPDLCCTDRETSPETARDSSEVPQSAELGLGLRWYLSTPLSSVSTATYTV